MEHSRINLLDPLTSNKIAAGEVVERPSAVVKELVENAMDAGATQITVEVRQGGKTYIRISDNGGGILFEDLPLAFERHATSKIRTVQDLYTVLTLGFRGEALASIASVSLMEMITRPAGEPYGKRIELQGGRTVLVEETGAPYGTTVIVRDLFFNTPARMKFMKSNGAELSAITEWMSRLAVSRPEVSFRFMADHQDVFMTSGNGKLLDAVAAVYERSLAKAMIPIDVSFGGIRLSGFLGDLTLNRGNRQMQHFFVNGRTVRSNLLSEALEMGYQGLLPVNRFPVCFVHLELDTRRLDVNIHPAKIQIRFQEEPAVRQGIHQAVRETLLNRNLMPQIRYREPGVPRSENVPEQKPQRTAAPEPRAVAPTETGRISDVGTAYRAPAPAVSAPDSPASPASPVEPRRLEPEAVRRPLERVETPAPTLEPSKIEVRRPPVEATPPPPAERTGPVAMTRPETPAEPEPAVEIPVPDLDRLLKRPAPVQEPLSLLPENEAVFDRSSLYDDLTIIGQAFRTYILAEREETLYLIDQHAAHEKLLFEHYLRDWKQHRIATQLLLVPELLTLDPLTVIRAEELKSALEQTGYHYDVFGNDALLVREVPVIGHTPLGVELLRTLLQDFVRDLEQGKDLTDLRQELILRESCRKAIKAYDRLETVEIRSLLQQLKLLDSPYTCPHGRPIIVAIGKAELEKRFKRT